MRNIYIFIMFLLFFIRKESVILGATSALSFWSKSLFPILFPTFIMVDILLSSGIHKYVAKIFGPIFKKIFKAPKISALVFFISLVSGTPTNVKILKSLYDNDLITDKDITKILSFTFFFNPFLIISFGGIKVLLIIWISNIITGVLLRNIYASNSNVETFLPTPFSLNKSIQVNLDIVIQILGTITVFMVLSYMIPVTNPFLNTLLSSVLELSTALYKNKTYFNAELLYIFMLSVGGISIFMQIKSILKDTSIDYKFIILSRVITLAVGLVICCLT